MRLIENADVVIVLPGGPGTFDELWETSVYRILGLRGMKHIPICVVNIDGYYDGTIAQINRASEEQLLYESPEEYFHVEVDVASALRWALEASDVLMHRRATGDTGVEGAGSAWSSAEGGAAAVSQPISPTFH